MADLLREEERAATLDADMLGELAEGIARGRRRARPASRRRASSRASTTPATRVVTINAGEGGTDAQDWAEMLLRMYLRWAERRGLKTDLKEAQEGTEAGLKSATFTVHGAERLRPAVRRARRAPAGAAVARSTRPTAARPPSRRWTSRPLVSDDVDVEILDKDLKIDTYRASGAGGQHVNKTDSAVRITHLPSKIVVQCQNERSQTQNRATAMALLRARLVQTELERREAEAAKDRGESQSIGFGSQIRSYVDPPVHDGQGPPHRPRDRQRAGRARRRPRRVHPRRAGAPRAAGGGAAVGAPGPGAGGLIVPPVEPLGATSAPGSAGAFRRIDLSSAQALSSPRPHGTLPRAG